jgi:RNA polymerase sigma-B factor
VVRINMGVARDVARRYEGRGLAAEDLQQVAYLGLVKAVQNFDAAKGGDFLSYAVPTVRGEVRRWFRDHGWMVRPPRSVQELQARITRARSELTHELGRPPRIDEIAGRLDEDVADVERAMAANGCFAPTSLDSSSSPEEEGPPHLVQTLGAPDPGYAEVEARVVLTPLLRGLDERERLMLRMRFVDGATQAEIGQELGVTQTQVSRLMSALLLRMRDQLGATPQAA